MRTSLCSEPVVPLGLGRPSTGGLKQGLNPVHDLVLVFEQPFFSPETAAISDQVFFGPDDAVTGYDDDDVIPSVGGCRGADSPGITEPAGQFEIAERFSEGNSRQLVPHPLLKGRTALADGEIEDASLSLEILDQLFDTLDDHGCNRPLEIGAAQLELFEMVDKADLADIGVRAADAE